jgi:sugar phosphate permease
VVHVLGWMFFNTTFYGLLTWMPTYLFKVHDFDIKVLGSASFIIFFAAFVGELVGGWLGDTWRSRGGAPNAVFRTLFGIAAIMATVSNFQAMTSTLAWASNSAAGRGVAHLTLPHDVIGGKSDGSGAGEEMVPV